VIRIRISKKKYRGVYRWDDIPLSQFCDLADITMPEGYEGYILADGDYGPETVDKYVDAVMGITPEQIEGFTRYYRKVIGCLTNIPVGVINKLNDENINELYEYYFRPFVVSILYNAPVIHFMGQIKDYEPPPIRSFKVKGRRYYLPAMVNIMGQDIPLAEEPIITYSEASDIFRGMKISRNDVRRLALFMAIYCRRLFERYDERKALGRQDVMMQVPMSVVWSVFFYTVRRLRESTLIIQLFGNLPETIQGVIERVRACKSTVREA